MAVQLRTGSPLQLDPPVPLFDTSMWRGRLLFDVTAGGKRFLFYTDANQVDTSITLIQNWTGSLPK